MTRRKDLLRTFNLQAVLIGVARAVGLFTSCCVYALSPAVGVHESQSLLWERMVALSPPFATYLLPRLKARRTRLKQGLQKGQPDPPPQHRLVGWGAWKPRERGRMQDAFCLVGMELQKECMAQRLKRARASVRLEERGIAWTLGRVPCEVQELYGVRLPDPWQACIPTSKLGWSCLGHDTSFGVWSWALMKMEGSSQLGGALLSKSAEEVEGSQRATPCHECHALMPY
eukprot:1161396-Pelagomonas_calceolata.AAC.6